MARIRERFPKSIIIAGNVATPEMVQELLISGGADIVKCGIGPGSVCTTRIVTGVGYPQLSAAIECSDAAHGLRGHVMVDGGCRITGDINKAFGAGADFVMLGGMLAGHAECEGEWIYEEIDERYAERKDSKKLYLEFYGMSSEEANDRYNGGLGDYKAAEGKLVRVPYRGPVKHTLQKITGALMGCCQLIGSNCLKDVPKCTTFVRTIRTHNTVFGD